VKAQVTPVRVIGLPILVLPVLIAPGVKALVVYGAW
jgi:hypothetical protein